MSAKARKVNPIILDSFWHLVEEDVHVRSNAALKILQELKNTADSHGQVTAGGDLHYTLTRLVRGLASDRKFARRGYASMLCQLIQHFSNITTDDLLSIATSSLKTNDKNLTKKEVSNVVLGKVLLYLTLLQTGLIKKASEDEVTMVSEGLLECAKLKPPLQTLCTSAVGQLIAAVREDQFSNSVMPALGKSLKSGWEGATADSVHMLLVAVQCWPETISQDFLLTHWKCKKIIYKENFPHFVSVLSRCSTPQHPLGNQLVQLAMKQGDKLFSRFWAGVITDGLMKLKKKPVCLEMTRLALRMADSPAKVQAILNDNMTDFITKNCFLRAKTFQKEALRIMESLPDVMHQYAGGEQQVTVIKAFLRSQNGFKFCENKLVENTVMKMSAEGGKLLVTILKDTVEGYTQLTTQAEPNSEGGSQPTGGTVLAESDQRSALQLLAVLVRQQYATGGIQPAVDLVQWLFLHAFFALEKVNAGIPHCHRQPKQIMRHDLADDALFRCLTRLTTFNPGVPVKVHHEQNIEILYQLVQYANVLLSNKGTVSVISPLGEKSVAAWDDMLSDVEKMRTKHGKGTELGQGHAFQMLLLYLALQLFKDQKAAVEPLQDVHVCCEKAFQKRRKSVKLDQDEPGWLDVTMELLLSMLSLSSAIVRSVANTVFTLLCPNMTTSAMQLILTALASGSAEEDPLDFEDDEDESENEEGEDGKTETGNINGTEAAEESSSDDEDDDEMEDDEAPVDDKLRQSVKKALGSAVGKSDDEGSDSASDLDDEAMSKLDGALAAAFRSMRRSSREGQKKRERQIRDFKQRVMRLLEIFAKSDAPSQVVLELVFPMLDFMDSTSRDQNSRDLSKRANHVFHQLCSSRKFGPDQTINKAELPNMVTELIQRSKKVSGIGMVKEVAAAINLLIRIAQGLQKTIVPSPVKTRSKAANAVSNGKGASNSDEAILNQIVSTIVGAIQDFCERKDHLLNHLLFHTILEKYPVLLWNVSDILLGYLSNENIKVYCKTQLCSMLAAMMNKDIPRVVGAEAWSSFVQRVQQVAVSAVAGMVETGVKAKYAHELVLVVNRTLRASTNIQVVFPESFIEDLNKMKNMKKATSDVTKGCNKLLGYLSSIQRVEVKKRKQDSGTDSVPKKKSKKGKKAGKTDNVNDTSAVQRDSLPNGQDSEHAGATDNADTPPKKKKKKKRRNSNSLSQTDGESTFNDSAVSNASIGTDVEEKTPKKKKKKHKN